MQPTRRDLLKQASAGGIALSFGRPSLADDKPKRSRLGIALSSYAIRSRLLRDKGFRDPIRFVEFCQQRGAGGVQLPIGSRDKEYVNKLRRQVEKHDSFLEGSISAPRAKTDVARFEAEVRTAKEAGVTVLRSVMLGGRRYETFKTAGEFRDFEKRSIERLRRAEPIVARHKMRLAIENHKDFRADEMLRFLKSVDSEHVGVCVDTGNNVALLEDALEMTKVLAPVAFSCHVKDMGVEVSRDGFLLSEVALGTGLLDLKQIVRILIKSNPRIQFCLEMITRDPLRIPCLTDLYWATMGGVPGRDLARTLAWVRKHPPKKPLPRISKLEPKRQLEIEEENVRVSLRHAREHLF